MLSFQYNAEYFQVINQAGDSYRKDYRINQISLILTMTYQFFKGDGSNGNQQLITQVWLRHTDSILIDEGILTEKSVDEKNIPIRIDFLNVRFKERCILNTGS